MPKSDPETPTRPQEATPAADQPYEAPAIEATMTADELEREVLYAGNNVTLIVCS